MLYKNSRTPETLAGKLQYLMVIGQGAKRITSYLHDEAGLAPGRPRGTVLIEGVTKRFRKHRALKSSYSTFKTSVINVLLRRAREPLPCVQALGGVSIKAEAGASIGIIGRNGSGKSTLLKMIAGIYRPDTGQVRTSGRISALIELGAGFHPDFTGRENIYLGGVMYGLGRKEIDQKFDDIVSYAELEDFIDEPVRTYSSGMYMRLGFSLAIHTDPDILLVDEVIAVGDAAFMHRCRETISDFKRRGKTLVFVTHDLDSVVRWCDEAVWLDKGLVIERGHPRYVIDRYLQSVEEGEEQKIAEVNISGDFGAGNALESEADSEVDYSGSASRGDAGRWGSRDVEITSVEMRGDEGERKWLFRTNEAVSVEIAFRIRKKVSDLVIGIGIIRADGIQVYGTNTSIDDLEIDVESSLAANSGKLEASDPVLAEGRCRIRIPSLSLLEDAYFLDVALHKSDGFPFDYHHRMYKFSVRSPKREIGVFRLEHAWEIEIDRKNAARGK